MGSSVDFFVANTVLYWQCVHENHQADMANIDPLKDIVRKLILIFKIGKIEYSLKKNVAINKLLQNIKHVNFALLNSFMIGTYVFYRRT